MILSLTKWKSKGVQINSFWEKAGFRTSSEEATDVERRKGTEDQIPIDTQSNWKIDAL